jgi:protein phosphatase
MEIHIPETSLVVLIGPSAAGKSTFCRRHFVSTEVLSSDDFRALVSNDRHDQSASSDAFALLYAALEKRLQRRLLTVVDATNLNEEDRQTLLQYAKKYQAPIVAILFDLPDKVHFEHNQTRGKEALPNRVIKRHLSQMWRVRKQLKKERFRRLFTFQTVEEVEQARIIRQPLKVDRRLQKGPFDLIGDVHGCLPELLSLLAQLDYQVQHVSEGGRMRYHVTHPQGRKVIFVGDLVDRGPDSPGVLELVREMVQSGQAFAVCGNHDQKLIRYLQGKKVQLKHGIEQTIAQLEDRSKEWKEEILAFLQQLPSHLLLDRGELVVAHAGLPEELQGGVGGQVRNFALYGEKTGEIDDYGVPVRRNWAEDYRGKAFVVYGHSPVAEPMIYHNTIDIDTGCAFGGRLTALRYPERTLVSVPARETYAELRRPLLTKEEIAPGWHDAIYVDDLLQLGRVETRFHAPIRTYEDQRLAAFESTSRFAVDPRWLIYLPPTMSPSETSTEERYLEHPREAFAYYQKRGIRQVVCEEKHMGSRAIVIVCRHPKVPLKRFSIDEESYGIIYTRTGRRFFTDRSQEQKLLQRLAEAMEQSGFWERFVTDWACLDCEFMPWSAKAQTLLKDQYAAVGAAATQALQDVVTQLQQAEQEGRPVDHLLALFAEKHQLSHRFQQAYRLYCWPVKELTDYQLAPFHLMATEGKVYFEKTHAWHLSQIDFFCQKDPAWLVCTRSLTVDLEDEASIQKGVDWWLELTTEGGEGMVVKPPTLLTSNDLQPAIKCRGREYLRIIYGLDYTMPEQLQQLRKRGLKKKRSLAIREFALGLEALQRFVDREPLSRVHECCFALLALESEPVDPRL